MTRTGFLNQLRSLAKAFAREPGETERIEDRSAILAKYALFGTMGLGLIAFFLAYFVPEVRSWSTGRPVLPVDPTEWRVLYSDPKDAMTRLWTSPYHRTDPDHRERVRALQGKVFWVGTEISASDAQKALEEGAFQFIVGYVSGDYKIWIDDEIAAEGSALDNSFPIVLRISLKKIIRQGQGRIAIRIVHNANSSMPDLFNSYYGGEGLASEAAVRSYLKQYAFSDNSRPFAFAMSQLILAALFFFFWQASPKKQEYFYLACFALVHAWIQLSLVGFIYRAIGWERTYTIDCVLRLLEGTFAFYLGLSFARAPRDFFKIGLPVFLLLPLLAIFLPFRDTTAKLAFSASLGQIFVPCSYFSGAAACLLQGFLLKKDDMANSVRCRRLFCFGAAFAVMTAIYWIQSSGIASTTELMVSYRFAHFGVMLFLGVIVISEYRETEKIVTKSYLSKYHRRPVLPGQIRGVLLKVDLKGSTRLETDAGLSSQYGTVATVWFSWMADIILRNGGELLSEEGDQISAFFDKETHRDPLSAAIRAARQMEVRQQDVPRLFGLERKLCFRGSLASGDLAPVWKQSGTRRLPGYQGSILVDSSRLMDLEYDIEDTQDKTLLVLAGSENVESPDLVWKSGLLKKDADGKERVIQLIWLKDSDVKISVRSLSVA